MDRKILIALQFWDGDRAPALELARFLADLETAHSDLADFMFMARFDCKLDDATTRYVSRKFNTYSRISRRRAKGWPCGCNDLWFSVMEWAQSMIQAKKIPHYKAIFTCEADGCPIQRDWIAKLSAEWDRVNKEKPVVIAGALVPPGPHINGNCLVSGEMNFLTWIGRRVGGVSPHVGWDYLMRDEFKKRGWADLPGVKSIYNTPHFTQEQYQDMIRQNWIWVHGIKDMSLIQMGRDRFKV